MNRGMINAIGTVMFAIAFGGMVISAQAQMTWYVDDDTCPSTGTGSLVDPFCIIQDGIDAAADGDMVLVNDGTYSEAVDVDKEDLTVVSVNGAATTTITHTVDKDTPVVTISADGVTLGGFTIDQTFAGPSTTPHLGNAAVKVLGDVVGLGSVTIQNNTLVGNDTDEGILINPNIEGGHLIVQNNTFEMGSVGSPSYSFKDAVHFHFSNYGDPIFDDVAAHTASIDLLNNTADDFNRSAIYFHGDVYRSTITINPSSFTGVSGGATYGVYFDDDIRSLSSVDISGTSISNVIYGVFVNDRVQSGSSLSVSGNSITDFTTAALYINDDVEESSSVTVDGDIWTGDAGGATYGLYLNDGIKSQSNVTINNTEISNFTTAGIYNSDNVTKFASLNITGNTLTAHPDGSEYGIYTESIKKGGTLLINPNVVTGFGGPNAGTGYGLYIDKVVRAGSVVVDGNTFTAHASGADFGIYISDEGEGGGSLSISNNEVSGFTDTGIYHDGVIGGGFLAVDGNTVTGDAGGATYGLYINSGIKEGSKVTINNTEISNFTSAGIYNGGNMTKLASFKITGNTLTAHPDGSEYGIFTEAIKKGATLLINPNEVTGFGGPNAGTGYGLFIEQVIRGSSVVVDGNTFTAHTSGADFGIYISDEGEGGGSLSISNNEVTGFTDTGIYDNGVIGGGFLTVDGNTITGAASSYGIFVDDLDEGSNVSLTGNDISGIAGTAGLYVWGPDDGSTLNVTNNTMDLSGATTYGIRFATDVTDGSLVFIIGNDIQGFDTTGILFDDEVWGSGVVIENNLLVGGSADGIEFTSNVHAGAFVGVTSNCFENLNKGVIVFDLLDTATMDVHLNDFAGTTTGVDASGVTNTVDAENNWFGGSGTSGNVNASSPLAGPPDSDGDGVVNCSDLCAGTPGGQPVDSDGCPLPPPPPPGPSPASPPPDGDGDGVPDASDDCQNTAPGDNVDDDGCSTDDDDGDGVLNDADDCPGTPECASNNVDADGCPVDTDGDGILDGCDNCPNDSLKLDPGACGCGSPDTDSDGDLVPDCVDDCPNEGGDVDVTGCPVAEEAPQPVPTMCGAIDVITGLLLLGGVAAGTGLRLTQRRRRM